MNILIVRPLVDRFYDPDDVFVGRYALYSRVSKTQGGVSWTLINLEQGALRVMWHCLYRFLP
jgi:hypothetical protein